MCTVRRKDLPSRDHNPQELSKGEDVKTCMNIVNTFPLMRPGRHPIATSDSLERGSEASMFLVFEEHDAEIDAEQGDQPNLIGKRDRARVRVRP